MYILYTYVCSSMTGLVRHWHRTNIWTATDSIISIVQYYSNGTSAGHIRSYCFYFFQLDLHTIVWQLICTYMHTTLMVLQSTSIQLTRLLKKSHMVQLLCHRSKCHTCTMTLQMYTAILQLYTAILQLHDTDINLKKYIF